MVVGYVGAINESCRRRGTENSYAKKNSYHKQVPAITVILDGDWSKRTNRHSYNALSGVGVIFRKETGKLLYIGVRNKYCAACVYQNKQTGTKKTYLFQKLKWSISINGK